MTALYDAAHAAQTDYIATLEKLVKIETPSRDRTAAAVFVEHVQARLEQDGWQVSIDPQTEVGDHIIARQDATGDTSTLILAHYDTVWPVGTLKLMPFKQEDGKVYGPGTLDMKAGITTSLEAVRILKSLNKSLIGPVTLLITSDEEIGSHHSRELIEREAKAHDRVFVVEPGREDGAFKTGRKGGGGFNVNFKGISAHAGNNPQDGASALRELAHFLLFTETLNDADKATSVNLTVASGGSVSNVIAEEATARIDMRVLELPESERVIAALAAYEPRDSRVSVDVEGGLNRPPLEPTPTNQALFEHAQSLATAMGTNIFGAVVGGGSDGNFTSALGIPTLDGMGSTGEGPHARHEHIRIHDTLDRLALMAALLAADPS
jgi:glutamate carboxypeptidase